MMMIIIVNLSPNYTERSTYLVRIRTLDVKIARRYFRSNNNGRRLDQWRSGEPRVQTKVTTVADRWHDGWVQPVVLTRARRRPSDRASERATPEHWQNSTTISITTTRSSPIVVFSTSLRYRTFGWLLLLALSRPPSLYEQHRRLLLLLPLLLLFRQ